MFAYIGRTWRIVITTGLTISEQYKAKCIMSSFYKCMINTAKGMFIVPFDEFRMIK